MKKTTTFSSFRISALSLMMVVGLFLASSAYAADITYAAVTGDWTDANWTPQAPVSGDRVIIPAGAVVTVSTDLSAIKLNNISVLGTLTIANSGSLTVEQTASVNPLVNVGGGVLTNEGTLSIKQTLANSNAAINLSNGTDADAKFINVGTLSIDMLASTIASSSTRCIYLSQTTATRLPRLTLGGTMSFSVPTGTRFFELGGGANAVIDGTAVIGSALDYKNWRLIHMGNGGTLTLAGSLEFYSSYISGNGVISQSVTGTGSAVGNVVNSGTLKIHGMSGASGSYALYLNAQRAGTSPNYTYGTAKFKNTGTLTIDGNYPTSYGAIYLNGNPNVTDEFRNEGTLTVTNTATSPAISCQIANVVTGSIINSGTMSLSSAGTKAIVMGDANSSITNTGTITLNKSITGYSANATAATINNNALGVFNFDVADNAAIAIDAANKIIFTNNGGKVTGRGVIGVATFVPSTGILSPGGDAGIGTFTFSDASLALTGIAAMNVNGTTASDYDQITSTGTLDVAGLTLEVTVGGAYSPVNQDLIPLFSAVSRAGSFASVVAPTKWVANYTDSNANILYDNSTAFDSKHDIKGKVYANGQNIYVNLASDASAQLQLTDMTGRLIKQIAVKGENNVINAGSLKGIYIVRLLTATGNYSQKVSF